MLGDCSIEGINKFISYQNEVDDIGRIIKGRIKFLRSIRKCRE